MGNRAPGGVMAASTSLHELSPGLFVVREALGGTRATPSLLCSLTETAADKSANTRQVVVKRHTKTEPSPLIAEASALEAVCAKLAERPHAALAGYQRVVDGTTSAFLVRPYFAHSLFDRLATHPFPVDLERRWFAYQAVRAVAAAHQRDICHGDITCENFMVTSWSWVVLTDFAAHKPTYVPASNPTDIKYYFQSAEVDSSRCHLAPERFCVYNDSKLQLDLPITPAMDVFSLGAAIAELLLDGHALFDLPALLRFRDAQLDADQFVDILSADCIDELLPMVVRDLHRTLSVLDSPTRHWLAQMLHPQPSYRASAATLCESALETGVFPDYFASVYDMFEMMSSRASLSGDADSRVQWLYEHWLHLLTRLETSTALPSTSVFKESFPLCNMLGNSNVLPGLCSVSAVPQHVQTDRQSTMEYTRSRSMLAESPQAQLPAASANTPSASVTVAAQFDDDRCLLLLNLLCAQLRSLRHPLVLLRAIELIEDCSYRCADQSIRLNRAVPWLLDLLLPFEQISADASISRTYYHTAAVRARALTAVARLCDSVTSVKSNNANIIVDYVLPVIIAHCGPSNGSIVDHDMSSTSLTLSIESDLRGDAAMELELEKGTGALLVRMAAAQALPVLAAASLRYLESENTTSDVSAPRLTRLQSSAAAGTTGSAQFDTELRRLRDIVFKALSLSVLQSTSVSERRAFLNPIVSFRPMFSSILLPVAAGQSPLTLICSVLGRSRVQHEFLKPFLSAFLASESDDLAEAARRRARVAQVPTLSSMIVRRNAVYVDSVQRDQDFWRLRRPEGQTFKSALVGVEGNDQRVLMHADTWRALSSVCVWAGSAAADCVLPRLERALLSVHDMELLAALQTTIVFVSAAGRQEPINEFRQSDTLVDVDEVKVLMAHSLPLLVHPSSAVRLLAGQVLLASVESISNDDVEEELFPELMPYTNDALPDATDSARLFVETALQHVCSPLTHSSYGSLLSLAVYEDGTWTLPADMSDQLQMLCERSLREYFELVAGRLRADYQPPKMDMAVSATSANAVVAARAAQRDWVDDEASRNCLLCGAVFSFLARRRHHCRRCGLLVCNDCSASRMMLSDQSSAESSASLERVCDRCVTDLKSPSHVNSVNSVSAASRPVVPSDSPVLTASTNLSSMSPPNSLGSAVSIASESPAPSNFSSFGPSRRLTLRSSVLRGSSLRISGPQSIKSLSSVEESSDSTQPVELPVSPVITAAVPLNPRDSFRRIQQQQQRSSLATSSPLLRSPPLLSTPILEVDESGLGDNAAGVRSERARHRVADELVESERQYMQLLETLNDMFMSPLAAAAALLEDNNDDESAAILMTEDQLSVVFAHIPALLALQRQLVVDLTARMDVWLPNRDASSTSVCDGLGDIFLRYAPFFKVYAELISSQETSRNTLSRLLQTNIALRTFVTRAQADKRCRERRLESLLRAPFAHFVSYASRLDRLARHTPIKHSDRESLEAASAAIESIGSKIETQLSERAARDAVFAVQIEFGDTCTLVAPHRVFIRRGALSKQCRRRRKEYEFVLFNDLLVYGSISAPLDSDASAADQGDAWSWSKLGVASKKLHRLLPIDASFACSEAALPDPDAEVDGSGETDYPFSIYSSTKSFLVFAPSAAQRAAWIADLRHCADVMQKRYRSNASDAARAAVVSARPVWASDDSATQCTLCAKEFSFFVRRHHCRRCGRLCCDDCSGARLPIDANPAHDAPLERQCDPCAEETRRNMSGSSELDQARVVAAAFEATAAVDSDASDNE